MFLHGVDLKRKVAISVTQLITFCFKRDAGIKCKVVSKLNSKDTSVMSVTPVHGVAVN